MKRFIGGVIITVLLSNPLALENNIRTYIIYFSPERIINIIKRKMFCMEEHLI